MGYCSVCGVEYLSTTAAAKYLEVVPQRVRALFARNPGRLHEVMVGRHRIVPVTGLASFQRQPSGVHLDAGAVREPQRVCIGCSEPFYSPSEAAAELELTLRWVYAVLAHEPERLLAFRAGEFWVIPQSGVDAYRRRQKNKEDVAGGQKTTAVSGKSDVVSNLPGKEVKVPTKLSFSPVVFLIDLSKLPPCRCGAYHFPHRRGGGPCKKERMLRGVYVPGAEVQYAWV